VGLNPDQKQVIKSNDQKLEESFLKLSVPLKHPRIQASEKVRALGA
jgi:hypothetical protein